MKKFSIALLAIAAALAITPAASADTYTYSYTYTDGSLWPRAPLQASWSRRANTTSPVEPLT